jgi:molybdopterin synthase catalytic subunit
MIEVKISDTPLDEQACIALAKDPACGGMVVFSGTARNETMGRKVVRLEYECYPSMALKELKKIAEDAIRIFEVKNVVIRHRIGVLNIQESAVVIAVNAPHRKAAFEACQYMIDTLKKTVPIWKKEVFEDGEEWVSAHP